MRYPQLAADVYYAVDVRSFKLFLRVLLLTIVCPRDIQAAIAVPTHGMIAYVGTFSDASSVEMMSNERFYNVVRFAVEVVNGM